MALITLLVTNRKQAPPSWNPGPSTLPFEIYTYPPECGTFCHISVASKTPASQQRTSWLHGSCPSLVSEQLLAPMSSSYSKCFLFFMLTTLLGTLQTHIMCASLAWHRPPAILGPEVR